ncbi:MAG: hypothetical protein WCB53_19685 [Terriglobales bacterium]
MKCKHILAALACALLALSTVGCGAFKGQTSDLKSITLDVALVNGVVPGSQSGFYTLDGNGGTIQLQAMGEYSGGSTKDITHTVTYNVVVDPNYSQDAYGNALVPPCAPPNCPVPQSGPPYTSGTVEYSPTGLLTAVEPASCTWVDIVPLLNGQVQPASWFYVGDYVVTVSYQGITSNPIYIPVASSAGDQYYPYTEDGNPAYENNPTGQCGPSAGS